MYIRITFITLFLLIASTTLYAESITVTCKGVNSNVEVNDFIKTDPVYSYLSFRFGNITYGFENDQIKRTKNVPVGAIAEQGQETFGYYVPIIELNSGSSLLRGRIFIAVKENGKIVDSKSSADNAICAINYKK